MAPTCVARGCNSGKCKRSCLSVSYFRFPLRNPILLKIWLRKIHRKNFKPTARSRLCSDHFEENCFEYRGPELSKVRKILKHNSIPTKFLNWERRPTRRVFESCVSSPSQTSSDLSLSQTSSDLSSCQTSFELSSCQTPSDLGSCQTPSDLGSCLEPSDLATCLEPSDLNPFLEPSDSDPVLEPSNSIALLKPSDSCPLPKPSDSCPLLERSDSCPLLERSDSCPVLEHSDSCPVLEPSDSCPLLEPSDSGPLLEPSDSGPLLEPSDSGPLLESSISGPCLEPSDSNIEDSTPKKDFCTLVEECCSAIFSKTSSNPDEPSEKSLSKGQETMNGFKKAFSEMFGKEKLIPENVPDDRTMIILTNFHRRRFFATFSFLEMDQIFQEKDNMRAVDQFFLFLIKLKTGLSSDILSIFFHISCDTASEIFAFVTDIMYRKLRLLKMFPTKERVLECMPLLFLHEYEDVRVIIDRVWFEIEKPKIKNEDKITFCPQRKTNIVKGMVGIMPSGAIIFITSLYCGNISDEHIFLHSRLMDYLEPNDVVIAENGFEVEKELKKIGCELKYRNYLEDKIVFDSTAGDDSVSFARPVARFKQYKYFDNVILFKNVPFLNNLFFITCMLFNFLDYPDTLDL